MKNSLENKLASLEKALYSFNHEEPLINSMWFMRWLSDHLQGQVIWHIAHNREILCAFAAAHLPDLESEIAALKAKIEKRDKAKERAADPVVSLKNLLRRHKFPKALVDVFVPLFFKCSEKEQRYHIDRIKNGEEGPIRFCGALWLAQKWDSTPRSDQSVLEYMNKSHKVYVTDKNGPCWFGELLPISGCAD